MVSDDVCAVIYADSADSAAVEVTRAVAAQSRPPGVVLGPGTYTLSARESAFTAGVRVAHARETRWIWLLDGRAVPEPEALEALLAAREIATAPTPVLLTGAVFDGAGHLHPQATPRHEIFEKAHSVDAAERHLVQLRFAAHGSVLVAGSVPDRFGAPRSDLPPRLDMLEWSARILRSWENTGYLVPASRAVRTAAPLAPTWRDWVARVRLLGSGAWNPTERLWEAFVLGGDLVGAVRGRGAAVRGEQGSEPP
ncbi:MAG: hypothetical protein WAK93_21650, partial [Solirubrobacteraceae bacterium]